MNKASHIYKIIAAFTALCVEFTSLSIPLARAEVAPQSAPSIKKINPELLKLPTKFGEVVESHAGNGSVIVIQDAHAIPDAQRNIANIIKHLQREYGVGTVALEGASGDLDPQIFRSFPDKKLLREVMKSYMDAGEIAGGTAAAIFDETSTKYQGVEDWEIYEEGLGLYLSAMEKEALLLEMLSAKRLALNAEKEKVYSKELLAIDQAVEKFYENAAQLTDLIKVLGAVQAPQAGSELEALWKEVSKQNNPSASSGQAGDKSQSKDVEVRELARKVEKVLKSPGAVKVFNSRKQEWMTGEISAEAFAMHLQQWADQSGLSLEMSSDLLGMVRDQQTLKGLEGTKLFRDLEIYIQSVKAKLIDGQSSAVSTTREIRSLDERTESLRLITRLTKLELPRQEWSELSKGKVFEALSALEINQDDLVFHLAFYLNAEERDQIFFENLQSHSELGSGSAKTMILVAGGFHAEGITSRLKEAGVGYALVMPKINHIPESLNYRSQMRGEVSWKDYFEVENGRIHLYKAFVRATRDKLLQTTDQPLVNSPSSMVMLKAWRDQIIRDLSDMGKVDRAAWYTRYMDEVVDDTLKSTDADKLMGKVDNFIRGLRGLEKTNQLNSEQIAALLKSNMIAPKNSVALVPGALSPVVDSVSTEVALGIVAEGLGVQAEGELPIAVSVPAAKLISKKLERITDQGSKQELILYEDGTFELTQDGVENPLRAGRIFQVGRTQIALFHENREYLDVQSSMINFAPVSTDSPVGIDTFLNMDYEALTGEGVLETLQPVAENILKLEGLADLIVVQAESGEKSDKSKQRGRVYRQLLRRYQVPFEDIEDAVIRVSRQNLETLVIKLSVRSASIEQSRSETRGSPETVNFFLANSSARTKSSAYEVVGQVKLKWPQAKIKIFYDLKDNLDSVSGLFSEYGDIEFSVMESSLPDLKDAYAVIVGPVSNVSRLGELAKSNKVIHVQPNLVGVSKYLDVLTPVNESAILSKYRLSNKPIVFANLWAENEFRLAAAAVRELFENSQFNLAPIILSPRFVNSGNIEKIKNILNENGIRFNLMRPGFSDGDQVDLTGKFVTILNTEGDQPEILKVASLTVAGHTLGEAGNPSHNVLEARSPIITGDISYVFPEQWDEEGMKEANDIIEGALQSGFVKTLGPNPDPGVLSGAIVELLSNKSEYERMKALNLKARTEAYEAAIRETDMNFDKWQLELDKSRSEASSTSSGQARVDQSKEFSEKGYISTSVGPVVAGGVVNKDLPIGTSGRALVEGDLDAKQAVSTAETHLFQSLFFAQIFFKANVNGVLRSYKEIQDAIAQAKRNLENAKGVDIDEAEQKLKDARRDKEVFLEAAQKEGFEEFLLKGDYGVLSRRLFIGVKNKDQQQRVLKSLMLTFASQDQDSLRKQILDLQAQLSEPIYSEEQLEIMLKQLERSFMFAADADRGVPAGEFYGNSDAEIFRKISEFIQVEVLTSEPVTIYGTAVSLSRDAEGVQIIDGDVEHFIADDVISDFQNKTPQWPEHLDKVVVAELNSGDTGARIINFGTGDPSPFSGDQDNVNLGTITNDRLTITDVSIRTLRNLERLGLLDRIEAIDLTHIHFDHVGGLLEIVRRKLNGEPVLGKLKLIMSLAVRAQFENLAALHFIEGTGRETGPTPEDRQKIDELFDYQEPTKAKNDAKTFVVEKYKIKGSTTFANHEIELAPTHGHPIPTFGRKERIRLPDGTFITSAYVSDSKMPDEFIIVNGEQIKNPRYLEFVAFFADSDIIIAENGVPGVHITPEQLVKAFPEHAKYGVIYTVHSAGPQTVKGLKRFIPGMVLRPKKFADRVAEIEKYADSLIKSEAIKKFYPLITRDQAIEFASLGEIVSLKQGAVIYELGEIVTELGSVFVNLEGYFDIYLSSDAQNPITTLDPGHIVGQTALLTKALTQEAYIQIEKAISGDKKLENFFFDIVTSDIEIEGVRYRVVRPTVDLFEESKKVGLTAEQLRKLEPLFNIAKSGKSIPRTAKVVAGAGATEESDPVFLQIHNHVLLQFLARADASKIDPGYKSLVQYIKGIIEENLESLKKDQAQSSAMGVAIPTELNPAANAKRSEVRDVEGRELATLPQEPLVDMSIDPVKADEYVNAHPESLRPMARFLVDNTTYINNFQFKKALGESVQKFKMEIGARPFVASLLGAQNGEPGEQKSSGWVYDVARSREIGLPEPAFINSGKAERMGTAIDAVTTLMKNERINDVVYIDDASYSGTQLVDWLNAFMVMMKIEMDESGSANQKKRQVNVHLLVPFMTNAAKKNVEDMVRSFESKYPGIFKIQFYDVRQMETAEERLARVEDVVERQILKNSIKKVYQENSLQKAMSYFQHKVPDYKSVPSAKNINTSDTALWNSSTVLGRGYLSGFVPDAAGIIQRIVSFVPPIRISPYAQNYLQSIATLSSDPYWGGRVSQSARRSEARDSYERYKILSGTLADLPDPVFVNDGETITLRIPHDEVEGRQPELDLLVVFKKINGKVFFAPLDSFSDLSLLEEYYRSADPLQEGSRVNWEEVKETSEVEIIGREEEMDSEGTKVKIVFSEQGFTIANASISDVYYFEGKPGLEIIASALRDSYLSGANTGLPIATEPIFIAGEDATEIFNLVTEFTNQGPYVPAAGETALYTKVKQQIRLITERTGEKYRFSPMIQINALSDTYRALNNFLMNRFTRFEGLEKGVVVLKRIPNLEKLIEVLRHLISAYELAFNHLENSTIEIEAEKKENHRRYALQMLVELKKIVNLYDSIPPAERPRAEIQGEVRMARLPSQKNFSELISYNGDKIPLWAIKRIYLPDKDNRVIQFGEISQVNSEDGVYDREDRTRDVRNVLSPFLESAEIVFELQDGVLLKRILEAEEYETITAVYPGDFDPKEFSKLPHGRDLPKRRFINAVNVNGVITTLYDLESLLPETGLAGRTVTFFYSANNHLQTFKISDEAKPQSEQYVYSQFRNSSNVQPMSAPFSAQETQEIAKKDLVDLFADLFNRRALTSAQRVVPLSALILQFLAVSLNAKAVSDWAQEGQVPLLEVDLANEQTISFSGLNPALHHDDAVRIERLLSQIDGGLDAASFRIVLAPAGPATQSNQAGQFFDRPGRGLDEFNAWHKLSDVLELFFLSVGETGKDKKLDGASKQKLLDKLAELVEAIAMIHPSVTGNEIYHTLYAVMDASTFRTKKLDTGSRINVLINLARQIRAAAPQDPQQSIYVQGEFESKLKTPNLDLNELAKETARSEARSPDSGQARELTVAEQQVGENVISFFQSPENYSTEEINQLADQISLLGEQSRLSSFITVLRSIAELKVLPVNSERSAAEGINADQANYASQVLLGRLMASKLERLINPPTIAFDAEVSDATLLDLAGKISPEFAQLIGAIQLRPVADLRKLFKDKGVTVMNINPKLADAAAVDASSELLSQLGLPIVGVVIDGQSNSFVDSTRIMLQIMIAVFIASRKDLQDKLRDGKAEEVKAEISLMLFQVGNQPVEGILQFKNGRLEIVQSQLAQFIETLFKAQSAVAVAA